MDQLCRPLIEVLAEIPDPRQARGKRWVRPAIVIVSALGLRLRSHGSGRALRRRNEGR